MKRAIIGVIVFLVFSFPGKAFKITMVTAEDLLKDAPTVLKGSVIKVEKVDNEKSPFIDTDVYKAEIQVHYVLKGEVLGAWPMVFFQRERHNYENIFTDLEPQRTYVLFIKRDNGGLRLYDPFNGGYPVENGDVAQIPGLDPRNRLRVEFENSLSSSNDSTVIFGLEVLFSIGNTNSFKKARTALSSSNEFIQVSAKALMLKHGDWHYVGDVAAYLNSCSSGFVERKYYFGHLMLWHMLYDSLGTVTNPAAQSLVMEVLQKNKEASVQDPLLASLENIADANAIDVLVPLFKGSDKMLVYDAYKVLAKICGRPMYNAEIFWKDRQKITGDIDQAIQREKKARQEGQNDLKTRHCCPK